ncbi:MULTISPECIES: FtsK/SpoIIIE domain-containing protein [Mycobacterium]|uniref:FtsK/SpoIIIE domain-containing protein n=1 Tax=Mycobacterium TaxID=1763 RepID=UPI0006CA9E5D|nr:MULTISPECIES: FtsK/SpoIIIE domain-containing protein [Mycobacterium]KPN45063.1 cell division protein FtsK [Mycobacterium intracellulare subsp. chimaera]KPN46836.1 cell division protein FtsK [Mycobacterium intracellulare subsp. chimaera]MBZ4572045.1 cell division protein FtsK [Mycobacterium avium subsp. hominissuis]MCA2310845.1 cell division protein FtsK [Mycobacterium intracellulare subsp. chimaera]MCA2349827.1 cell division protein FtsK [Mycobacterium intracellulare subsp. chimaera]
MSNTPNRNNRNTNQASDDDWVGELIWGLVKAAGQLLWWAILFPVLSIPVIVSIWVAIAHGPGAGLLTAGLAAAAYIGWAVVEPSSFTAWVSGPVRQRWLSWWRYRRTWESVCTLHGLCAKLGERTLVPALRSVRIGHHADVLIVRVVAGQSIADWQKRGDALAAAWRAERLTIRATTPGELRIIISRGDALAQPIALPMPTRATLVDLAAVRVGITEMRTWWRLPVVGHHILIAGATGAGKGSVLWSLIAGLAPHVVTGRVRLCVIDPKGGMELGAGAPMFSRFCHHTGQPTLELLRELVAVMQARANRLRGHTRLHTPTPAAPLIVVVIDEIAALTAYLTDRKIRTETEQLLGLLLSQGRAVGISVVAAVQDPAKDTLPVRQLFTVRIGLRMTEATQTAMVLGQGARDAGAECDLIADATPGVGYMMIDGTADPIRVRAFHVSDRDITVLARAFPAPRPRTRGNAGDATPGTDNGDHRGQR